MELLLKHPGLQLVCVGSAFLAVLFLIYLCYRAFIATAKRARGRVVGWEEGTDEGAWVYNEVVEFEDASGAPHKFRDFFSVSWEPILGTARPVLYDPARPWVAQIDRGSPGCSFLIMFLVCVGLIALGLWLGGGEALVGLIRGGLK